MQDYKNHIRFYPPHHFVFYPVIIAGFVVCVTKALGPGDDFWLWAFLALIFVLIGWLSFMLRQHYALNLQNRLVVLEMKFRYLVLTGKRLDLLADRLSFGQIAALRFASDAELTALVDRAVLEGKAFAAKVHERYFANSELCNTCNIMTPEKKEAYINTLVGLQTVSMSNVNSSETTDKVANGEGCLNWKFYACSTVCATIIEVPIAFAACMALCISEYCDRPLPPAI